MSHRTRLGSSEKQVSSSSSMDNNECDERPPVPPVRLTSQTSSYPPLHFSPSHHHNHTHQSGSSSSTSRPSVKQLQQQLKSSLNFHNHQSPTHHNRHHNSSSPVDLKPLPKEPHVDKKSGKMMKGSSASAKSSSKKNPSDGKDGKKLVISPPTDFEHTVHVGFDSVTGEFTGMPESWSRLLQASNISKNEQKKNPQAVLDVLKWFDEKPNLPHGPKYMTMNMGMHLLAIK